jgi:hypothetical protein
MLSEYHKIFYLHKIAIGVIVFEETTMNNEDNFAKFLFGIFLLTASYGILILACLKVVSAFRRRGNGCLTKKLAGTGKVAYSHRVSGNIFPD